MSHPKPIAYYKMTGGSGTNLADRSEAGNNLSGTLSDSDMWDESTNATVHIPGAVPNGYSLNFDADGDYVTIAKNSKIDFDYNDPFSVSMWIKIPSTSAWKILIANDEGASDYKGFIIALYLTKVYFMIQNTWNDSGHQIGRTGDTAVTNNAWRHVVCTYNGNAADSGLKIYVDGTETSTYGNYPPNRGGLGTHSTVPSTDTRIGQGFGTSYHFTGGKIDEVSIWDFALSDAQVTGLYNNGTPLNVACGVDGAIGSEIKEVVSSTSCSIKKVGTVTATEVKNISDIATEAPVAKKLPLAYYNMAGGSGTNLVDRSDASYNISGTLSDSNMWDASTKAAGSHSLEFDADGDKVTIAKNSRTDFEHSDAFSFSMWMKIPDQGTTWRILFSNTEGASGYQGYQVGMYDGTIRWNIQNTWNSSGNGVGVYGGTNVDDNSWKHIVCTYDGSGTNSGMKIYVNGSSQSTSAYPGSSTLTTSIISSADLRIGEGFGTGYYWTNGWIDEFSIWNFALSSDQVTTIYNSGTPLDVSSGID